MKEYPYRLKLREQFTNEKYIDCTNEQGEYRLDYVIWLELRMYKLYNNLLNGGK